MTDQALLFDEYPIQPAPALHAGAKPGEGYHLVHGDEVEAPFCMDCRNWKPGTDLFNYGKCGTRTTDQSGTCPAHVYRDETAKADHEEFVRGYRKEQSDEDKFLKNRYRREGV